MKRRKPLLLRLFCLMLSLLSCSLLSLQTAFLYLFILHLSHNGCLNSPVQVTTWLSYPELSVLVSNSNVIRMKLNKLQLISFWVELFIQGLVMGLVKDYLGQLSILDPGS